MIINAFYITGDSLFSKRTQMSRMSFPRRNASRRTTTERSSDENSGRDAKFWLSKTAVVVSTTTIDTSKARHRPGHFYGAGMFVRLHVFRRRRQTYERHTKMYTSR